MKSISIHPIPLFRIDARFEKPMMTYLSNFGQDLSTCVYVWFIAGGEKKILIDAGATAETAVARGRPRDQVTHIQSLEEGLAKLALKPSDMNTIILTHLHWDHVELASRFVNARFVVQRDELSFALDPHPIARSYDKQYFQGLDFEVVSGDTEITKGVSVLLTPGHTPGGQSVAVETENGIAVITGFCCIRDNFEPGEEIGKAVPFVVSGIHLDAMQAYDSMLRVKKIGGMIIPIHEPGFARTGRIP